MENALRYLTKNIVCPHCHEPVFSDKYRDVNISGTISLRDDLETDKWEWCKDTCNNCEKEYHYHVVVEVFYVVTK